MNSLLPTTFFLTLRALTSGQCCAGPMLACGVRTPKKNTMPCTHVLPRDRARNEQAAVVV